MRIRSLVAACVLAATATLSGAATAAANDGGDSLVRIDHLRAPLIDLDVHDVTDDITVDLLGGEGDSPS